MLYIVWKYISNINNYDIDRALRNGADKICLNSGAVRDPHIIKKAVSVYGSSTISAGGNINILADSFFNLGNITANNNINILTKQSTNSRQICKQIDISSLNYLISYELNKIKHSTINSLELNNNYNKSKNRFNSEANYLFQQANFNTTTTIPPKVYPHRKQQRT